ncbi:NADPH-dependent FMN reductase [Chishuiella sp.]|uniref:NADPH-dependent FMN reductase n=1 Tax=Chishuiella sp. TaxID=1969467 RepID=UPI0028AE1020|nr:NADPH-dependent FMN reductase [Chishuiella sp.]
MNILAIIGSATEESSNLKLVEYITDHFESMNIDIFNDLKNLPHFNTSITDENTPETVQAIKSRIEKADGIIFSTPEYIFSIPSGLKNLLEWCVSSVIFTNKPVSIITASASGEKGHEELKLILETLGAKVLEDNNLLIKGIKGRFDNSGQLNDQTANELNIIINHFIKTVEGRI